MADHAWFESWFDSSYYHRLYFERDDREAADFIKQLLAHLNPPAGSRMLDIACGKGRHSKILSEYGYDVTGIDLSENSIRKAKEFETDHLHFYRHDMRLPFWINYFDYAFNFFTSFGYFGTRRDHDNALRTIAQAMKPGGTLVMDYLNAHYVEDHLVYKESKTIGEVHYYITRWLDENYFYKKIEIEDEALEEPLVYIEKVSKFSLGDFNDMFAYQGLQLQEVYGSYSFERYDVNLSPAHPDG